MVQIDVKSGHFGRCALRLCVHAGRPKSIEIVSTLRTPLLPSRAFAHYSSPYLAPRCPIHGRLNYGVVRENVAGWSRTMINDHVVDTIIHMIVTRV